MTTLANCCRWLARLQARPWTTEEAAALAGCDLPGARCYLRRLSGQRVLVEIEPDRWRPGPAAVAWAKTKPKTREGGNSVAYRAAKALRERLAAEDWKMAREGGDLTGTPLDYSVQPCPEVDTMAKTKDEGVALIDFQEAAKRLACSRKTVRRLVASKQLPVVRLSATHARIPAHALGDLIERKMQGAMT